MNEWISTKERLPDKDVYVLWAVGSEPQEGWYDPWPNGEQHWRSTRYPSLRRSMTEVAYWKPLDAPPEAPSEL